MILSVYLIPILYYYIDRAKEKLTGIKANETDSVQIEKI